MIPVLEHIELNTGAEPVATIIWLHGLGADGYDFVPVVRELDINALPGLKSGVRFIFPHAPVRPVTINNNMAMRAWYDIKLMDLVRQEDEDGVRASQKQIEALIARENTRGVPNKRIVLAGFSQGGAITLQTGLRQRDPLAGLMVLSSYLPLAATLKAEAAPESARVPIFMAHGAHDPVVPLARAQDSLSTLQGLGYKPDWQTYPMEHSVCGEELGAIRVWLSRVLAG
jgi:phospholipase/carboxylesterase